MTVISKQIKEIEANKLTELYKQKKEAEKLKGNLFTQKSIAKIGKWSQPYVSTYLRGIAELKEDTAAVFAEALGVPIEAFSPRLADKMKQRELLLKNPSLDRNSISYVPKYDDFGILDLVRNHLRDKEYVMLTSNELTPVIGKASKQSFSIELKDDSLSPKYSKGTIFIFDPHLEPRPTDIVLVGNKFVKNDYHIRSYSVKEITGDGVEVVLDVFNPAYPVLKDNYEVLGVAIGSWKDMR